MKVGAGLEVDRKLLTERHQRALGSAGGEV
jgi:hypothetical protein